MSANSRTNSSDPDCSETQRLGPLRERTRQDREEWVVREVVARIRGDCHRNCERLLSRKGLQLVMPLSELDAHQVPHPGG